MSVAETAGPKAGERIRRLRRARGLTLARLGETTGLSHPFLSQIERGLATPSMDALERIAAALGTSAAALVAPMDPGSPRYVANATAPPVSARPRPIAPGVRAVSLTHLPGLLQVVEVRGAFPWLDPLPHPGQELLYVAEGSVGVEVGGERFALDPGDSIVFDATVPHCYHSPREDTRFVTTVADPAYFPDDWWRAMDERRIDSIRRRAETG